MSQQTDAELLLRAARGSREALGQIARRYVNFVYRCACRQVHDPHFAEDVTQAVFLILARKIRRIDPDTLLHGWFFTTTRYAAANALKMRARRSYHEQQAAAMRHEHSVEAQSESIGPQLDAALAGLPATDRDAVLLSYFAAKSWREVGLAIGVSEEAARKRVERAVDRMRRIMAARGVQVSLSAIAGGLSAAATGSAPAGLVDSVTNCMAAPALAGAVAKGVIAMMAWAKVKVAATVIATLLLGVGFAGAMAMQRAPQSPVAEPAAAGHTVTIKGDVTVELLEVYGDDFPRQSWLGDGSAAKGVDIPPHVRDGADGHGSYTFAARVTGADGSDLDARWSAEPSEQTIIQGRLGDDGARYAFINIQHKSGQTTVDLRVEIAAGEWQVAATREGGAALVRIVDGVAFGPLYNLGDRTATTIADERIDQDVAIVAFDLNDNEHPALVRGAVRGKSLRQTTAEFELAAEDIDRIEVRTRPYDRWVEFRNVSLIPNKDPGFEMRSGER